MTKNIKLFPYLRRFDEKNSMRYWCTQWLVYCIQEIVGKQGLGERENLCENTETPQIFINEKTYAQHIVFSINLYARLLWYWCVPLGNIHGVSHADVIKWKHFPRYWPFVRGIHRSPVNSPHKGQWHGAFMFSLICAWTNSWANNWDAGDLRRHSTRYDVTVMLLTVHAASCSSCVWHRLVSFPISFRATLLTLGQSHTGAIIRLPQCQPSNAEWYGVDHVNSFNRGMIITTT